MCWLLLVIWFEYKISRTISNPRLEITCFNPAELTPSEARAGEGDARQIWVSNENVAVTGSVVMILSPPVSLRRHRGQLLTISDTSREALSVSSSYWGVIWEYGLSTINNTISTSRLGLNVGQIWPDLRTHISQRPHTIICRYIHSDGDSNTTDMITGPNISGQFQIKTLRREGLGCGLLPAVNDGVRVWMFDYKGSRGAGGAYNPPITPALASINQGNVIRFVIIRFKLKYHWRWKILNMTAGAAIQIINEGF